MQLGSRLQRRERQEAHRDPLVEPVARAVLTAHQFERLLRYASTAVHFSAPPARSLAELKRGLSPDDVAATAAIDQAAASWRSTLDRTAFGHRRGAIFERLVSLLLRSRMRAPDVHSERRVRFSPTEETAPFDILGAPAGTPWEGIECKAGVKLDGNQGEDLSWAARTAARLGEPLYVIVASAASRDVLQPALKAQLRDPELVYFVAADSLLTLGVAMPRAMELVDS